MTGLPLWRRTSRSAPAGHFEGLVPNVWVEFPGYDDQGRQQGNVLAYIVEAADCRQMSKGMIFHGHVIAVQDGYYDFWIEKTFGDYSGTRTVPLHFCKCYASRCSESTMYREPIHVDVFRILEPEHLGYLQWLTDEHKKRLDVYPGLAGVSSLQKTPGDGPVSNGPEIQTGMPGIAGLAAALGGPDPAHVSHAPGPGNESREGRKRKGADSDKKGFCEALLNEIGNRHAPGPRLSALELSSGSGAAHRKKRKTKKRKSGTDSSSSDCSSESPFQLAALPKGVDRLHRMHQRTPGRLGSLTLQRCQELLLRSQGGGAAAEGTYLPAVARAYLNQIFLKEHSSQTIGLRNLKEMTTITTVIDYIASNDPLRALDVLVQRMKALEIAHLQGNWNQATHLELVKVCDTTSYFREELKAAQQELKSDWSLQRGPRQPGNWWRNQWVERPEVAVDPASAKEGGQDKPPENTPVKGGRPLKGKGKGKKGKFRRW